MRKKINPLFEKYEKVQTEKVLGVFEVLLKKLGLEYVYEYCETLVRGLLKRARSLVTLDMMMGLVEDYKKMLLSAKITVLKYAA